MGALALVLAGYASCALGTQDTSSISPPCFCSSRSTSASSLALLVIHPIGTAACSSVRFLRTCVGVGRLCSLRPGYAGHKFHFAVVNLPVVFNIGIFPGSSGHSYRHSGMQ